MPSIVNFDRDLNWVQMGADQPLTLGPSVYPAAFAPVLTPVNEVIGRMRRVSVGRINLQPYDVVSQAVVMLGPDETGGSCYRILGSASASNGNVRLEMFLGILDGSNIVWQQTLKVQREYLTIDETINLQPFGTIDSVDYSNRNLVVGLACINDTSSGRSVSYLHQLSVQRLVVKPPEYRSAVR